VVLKNHETIFGCAFVTAEPQLASMGHVLEEAQQKAAGAIRKMLRAPLATEQKHTGKQKQQPTMFGHQWCRDAITRTQKITQDTARLG
jgi:hypothetical protein